MIRKFKVLLAAFVAVIVVAIAPRALANEFHFSVTPEIPSNQLGDVGYFNLKMTPGQKQTLTVQLANSTDKTVVVEQSFASATTNLNGVVEYSPNAIKPDKSLKYNMKDLVSGEKEITLKPKSSQNVTIDVTMPSGEFKGQIAGGITYKEKTSDSSSSSSDGKGLTIQNQYAYVVGLVLQQSEAKVAPNLLLNDVAPGQVNYRNVINANLENPEAGYLNQMYVNAKVTGLSNKNLTYSASNEMMQMAPNTNFDYPIAIGSGNKLEPGKYRLTLTAYGQKDDKGQYSLVDSKGKTIHFDYKWEFTRDFEISGDKAAALNAKDVTIKHEKQGFNWWILVGIILILLALFLLFFLLWKRRKKDDEEEPNKEELSAMLKALQEELNEENSDKKE